MSFCVIQLKYNSDGLDSTAEAVRNTSEDKNTSEDMDDLSLILTYNRIDDWVQDDSMAAKYDNDVVFRESNPGANGVFVEKVQTRDENLRSYERLGKGNIAHVGENMKSDKGSTFVSNNLDDIVIVGDGTRDVDNETKGERNIVVHFSNDVTEEIDGTHMNAVIEDNDMVGSYVGEVVLPGRGMPSSVDSGVLLGVNIDTDIDIKTTISTEKTQFGMPKNKKSTKRMLGPVYMADANPCLAAKDPSDLIQNKYTIVMLIHGKCKWKQLIYDLTYEIAPRLDQIILLWNNDWMPKQHMLDVQVREGGPRVVLINMPRNSMNNRFVPWSPIRTAAVYILDMDIRLPVIAYEFAFDNWLQNQGSVVGYAYRRFYPDGTYPDKARSRIFGPNPGYNLVLTGSAMMSYSLLRQYSCDSKMSVIRNLVDEMFNGDDIAMNLIALYNGDRPVALTRNSPESEDPALDENKEGCLYNLGVNGRSARRKVFQSKAISTRKDHAMKRQDMFWKFADHLGLGYDIPVHLDFYQPPADIDICTVPEFPKWVMRGR
eukprot:CFRG7966T1